MHVYVCLLGSISTLTLSTHTHTPTPLPAASLPRQPIFSLGFFLDRPLSPKCCILREGDALSFPSSTKPMLLSGRRGESVLLLTLATLLILFIPHVICTFQLLLSLNNLSCVKYLLFQQNSTLRYCSSLFILLIHFFLLTFTFIIYRTLFLFFFFFFFFKPRVQPLHFNTVQTTA
jgi:hypothetical protein